MADIINQSANMNILSEEKSELLKKIFRYNNAYIKGLFEIFDEIFSAMP